MNERKPRATKPCVDCGTPIIKYNRERCRKCSDLHRFSHPDRKPLNPSGICQCGCGGKTSIVTKAKPGFHVGEHRQFINGHSARRKGDLYTIDEGSGCWNWSGSLTRGYGHYTVDGIRYQSHRWIYEQMVGPIPLGYDLDHTCKNPACVNPEHLEPVLPATNVRRGKCAKLTQEQVNQIRSLYPELSQNALARRFGVSRRNIRSILSGFSWSDPYPRNDDKTSHPVRKYR